MQDELNILRRKYTELENKVDNFGHNLDRFRFLFRKPSSNLRFILGSKNEESRKCRLRIISTPAWIQFWTNKALTKTDCDWIVITLGIK